MDRFIVVLVEPRFEGNVGAVARAMANFGLSRLVLVNPCPLGDDAYRRAGHAGELLERARVAPSLPDVLEEASLAVGTTAVPSENVKAFHRQALPPWDLAAKLEETQGDVMLVLGRENYGLYNQELDLVDLLVHVPASPDYPVLNLSHAACVLFYELYRRQGEPPRIAHPLASGFEKETLMEAFHEFLVATRYPAHKRRRTEVMFRRLVGRALPTRWEFHALMGAIRGAAKTVTRLAGSPGRGPSS